LCATNKIKEAFRVDKRKEEEKKEESMFVTLLIIFFFFILCRLVCIALREGAAGYRMSGYKVVVGGMDGCLL